MPKSKLPPGMMSFMTLPIENLGAPPKRFAPQKYPFSQLTEQYDSFFIPLEGLDEKNLRQNLIQHMSKYEEDHPDEGKKFVVRKEQREGELGLRIVLDEIKKTKKSKG